ncbi:MAG: methyltransferase domain-containing protein [Deltaproteobacteria bacterium]
MMNKKFFNNIPKNKKLVVELGIGDGNLIKSLSEKNHDYYFIGIEIQEAYFNKAKYNIKSPNVMLLNFSFEDVLPLFEDESIYKIISVLPDPKYIDKNYRKEWEIFYKIVYKKLLKKGLFILITEITDELFQPVSNDCFYKEVDNLKQIFQSIGFIVLNDFEGYQENYMTSFLQTFNGDPERIRIINFEFTKN